MMMMMMLMMVVVVVGGDVLLLQINQLLRQCSYLCIDVPNSHPPDGCFAKFVWKIFLLHCRMDPHPETVRQHLRIAVL
jgi:hypothetical protein